MRKFVTIVSTIVIVTICVIAGFLHIIYSSEVDFEELANDYLNDPHW